ncbi:MAG: hypothetical protein JWO37_3898 [Acidimicrobiales bacterium]|jgi:hypothetical protein|nr:hypothetical protein [Acidimicrobiales bacterium]
MSGEPPLPNFVVIGSMRGGTSSLTVYLRGHPGVFMAKVKELHYFDHNYDKGIEWYRRQFDGWSGQPAVGEASPSYLFLEEALPRLTRDVPEARLVATVRNPVDRAWSHYWFSVARGNESLSFADAIAAEPARLASGQMSHRIVHSYLARGRYLAQLQRAEKLVGRDRLHVIVFDDLRDRPDATYAELCRFLGIDDTVRPRTLGQARNEGRYARPRSAALSRVALRLPVRPRRAILRRNMRSEKAEPMRPELRRDLIARFAEDNAALGEWLGRDLSGWSREP